MFKKLFHFFRKPPAVATAAPSAQPSLAEPAPDTTPLSEFPPSAVYASAIAAPAHHLPVDTKSIVTLYGQWLLGYTTPAPEITSPHPKLEEAMAQLEEIAANFDLRRIPRLPTLVPQLMAMMRRERTTASEIAELLVRDPLLTGEVLRVANSVWYRRSTKSITTLLQAVRIIGHEGLRHALLASVMRPILRTQSGGPYAVIGERLWRHTESRMWLCGKLAVGYCDVSEAQLVGTLSGTGTSALLRTASLPLLAETAADPMMAPRFMAIAAQLSAQAAAHWQLPESVQQALSAEPSDTPLAQVLAASNTFAMASALVQAGWIPPETISVIEFQPPGSAPERLSLLRQLRALQDADASTDE